ncbi:MAG: glycosyltransferase family 9 protein [Gemmatimonas sp.]|jgi:ADP-heptose:LPS heptosyltransferase
MASAPPRLGRRIELWWRGQLVPVLARALWVRDRLPRGARRPGKQRVLFLRPDRIGDMIVTTGVLRAIGTAPDVELDVLASPANAPVLRAEPAVREVLVLDRKRKGGLKDAITAMRRRHYDVVVDCMPTAPSVTTLLIMMASGARRRVGTTGRGIDYILSPATRALPIEHHIVDHLSLLVEPFRDDVAHLDLGPHLVLAHGERAGAEAEWAANVPSGPRPLRLLVNISAGITARAWPLASYAQVIAAAREVVPSLQLFIMCAPHETARAAELAGMTGGRAVPPRPLRDAFALVATADALFTPDTSIAHAAAAFKVPTVDMLLQGKASQWGLYRAPGINLESPGGTLASLSVRAACDALRAVLYDVESHRTAR